MPRRSQIAKPDLSPALEQGQAPALVLSIALATSNMKTPPERTINDLQGNFALQISGGALKKLFSNKYICKDIWLVLSGFFLLAVAFLRIVAGVAERPDFFINSDSLYYAALYRDLFVDGFSLSGWALAIAPCFFPEMPLFFLLAALTSVNKATVLWGGALLLFWVLCALYLIRSIRIRKNNFLNDFVLVALCGALLVYFGIELRLPFWEDFFRLVHPHGSIATALLALAIELRYLRDGKPLRLFGLFFLVFLGVASDSLFLPLLVAPLLLVNILFLYKTASRGLWSLFVIVLSAQLASRLLRLFVGHKFFYLWHYKLEKENYSIEALQRLWNYPALSYEAMHFLTLFLLGLSLCLVIFFVLKSLFFYRFYRHGVLSQVLPAKKEKCLQETKTSSISLFGKIFRTGPIPEEQLLLFWAVFAWGSFVALWLASGISGLAFYKNPLQQRYFPGALSLHLLLGVSFLRTFRLRFSFISYSVLVFFVAAFVWRQQKSPAFFPVFLWNKAGKALSYRPPLAACLDDKQKRYNLRYGLSDYWASKLLNLYSHKGIRAYQIDAAGRLYHWVNNLWWYYGKGPTKPRYNFIITNGLTETTLQKLFGSPAKRFSCEGYTIWVYTPGQSQSHALAEYLDRKSLLLWKKLTGH